MDNGSEGVFLMRNQECVICWLNRAILLLLLFVIASWSEQKIVVLGDFNETEKMELQQADSLERTSVEFRAVKRFENSGFPAARVFEKLSGDSLFITLDKGEGYVFGESKNAVAGKTRENVFSRLTGLKFGNPVALNDVVRSTRRLERSGYYIKLKDTELYREQGRNRLVPLFYMQDASLSYAEGIVSYSSEDDEWVGSVDINLKNLAGTARDLQMNGMTGDGDRYVSLMYKEPWILDSEWNGLVRGKLQNDSAKTDALIEIGVGRSIGFEWDFALLGGTGIDYWKTTLEASYHDEDSFILPRHGSALQMSLSFKRLRDSSQYTVAYEGLLEHYVPIVRNFISRTVFSGGYLYPTSRQVSVDDLFCIGGVNHWKGYRPNSLKTRAYGNAEFAVRYQGIERTALEVFYEPGLYRGRSPERGWQENQQYGLGIVQYRDSFSVSVYYALRPGVSLEQGLLHLGVKTLF